MANAEYMNEGTDDQLKKMGPCETIYQESAFSRIRKNADAVRRVSCPSVAAATDADDAVRRNSCSAVKTVSLWDEVMTAEGTTDPLGSSSGSSAGNTSAEVQEQPVRLGSPLFSANSNTSQSSRKRATGPEEPISPTTPQFFIGEFGDSDDDVTIQDHKASARTSVTSSAWRRSSLQSYEAAFDKIATQPGTVDEQLSSGEASLAQEMHKVCSEALLGLTSEIQKEMAKFTAALDEERSQRVALEVSVHQALQGMGLNFEEDIAAQNAESSRQMIEALENERRDRIHDFKQLRHEQAGTLVSDESSGLRLDEVRKELEETIRRSQQETMSEFKSTFDSLERDLRRHLTHFISDDFAVNTHLNQATAAAAAAEEKAEAERLEMVDESIFDQLAKAVGYQVEEGSDIRQLSWNLADERMPPVEERYERSLLGQRTPISTAELCNDSFMGLLGEMLMVKEATSIFNSDV